MTWKVRIALSALLALAVPYLLDRIFTVYPSPETESVLLTGYNPQAIVKPFTCGHSWNASSAIRAGAGRGFAHYEKSFDGRYVLKLENLTSAMAALQNDFSSRLRSNGGVILEETGNAGSGFYFRYRSGRTLGQARILQPERIEAFLVEKHPPCAGEVAVELRTSLAEKWFRSDRDLQAELRNSD